MTKWFGPGQSNESDLLLQGSSWVEYRVEPGFTRLTGAVGREPSVAKSGDVKVKVSVDGETKWDEKVEGDRLLGFDVQIDGGRRVRIEVDCGDDGDLGDTIRILRPRLTK